MSKRINGVTAGGFGITWENNDAESLALTRILVMLESKRLVTTPWSRSNGVVRQNDIARCVSSALDMKAQLVFIISQYPLPEQTISILREMIKCSNCLLEDMGQYEDIPLVLRSEDDFTYQISIRQFKKSLLPLLEQLSDLYPKVFSGCNFSYLLT